MALSFQSRDGVTVTQKYYNSTSHSDFTITYGDKQKIVFHAHKMFFVTESPYFAKMFNGHSVEVTTNKTTLEGDNFNYVRLMLRYVYKFPTFEEPEFSGEEDDLSVCMHALCLYEVADKYDMQTLVKGMLCIFDMHLRSYVHTACFGNYTAGNDNANITKVEEEERKRVYEIVAKTYELASVLKNPSEHACVKSLLQLVFNRDPWWYCEPMDAYGRLVDFCTDNVTSFAQDMLRKIDSPQGRQTQQLLAEQASSTRTSLLKGSVEMRLKWASRSYV